MEPVRPIGSSTGRAWAHAEPAVKISVIVPVHNGSFVLARCLDALSRSNYPRFEVIVVDDCSTDSTPHIIERYGMQCVRMEKNRGPAAARNVGAKMASGDVLAFVDYDVVLPPDALSKIAAAFSRDSDLAAVFGSYDDEPESGGVISQYKNLMHHYVHQSARESATTFWSGCGAVRKGIFDELGGFDEAKYTVPSIEDVALGVELKRRGYSIRLDKTLTAKHLKRWTARSLLRADILNRAVPWTRLVLSSGQLPRDLNFDYASRISSALTGLLLALCILLPVTFAERLRFLLWPATSAIVAICVVLLLLNRNLYRFFWRKRGPWFALQSIVLHWIYYFYSGLAFTVTAIQHLLHSRLVSHKRNSPQFAESSRNS